MIIRQASSTQDLQGIIELQQKNLKQSLDEYQKEKEGFVTVHHTIEQLTLMNTYEPQIIVIDNEKVIGYALVMPPSLKDSIPILQPMFNSFKHIYYKGIAIDEHSYYVMGQICIDKAYRSQGLFKQLYDAHRIHYAGRFDYCITEISTSNRRSIRAHEKVGFQTIHTFTDTTDEWNIVVWDWR